MFAQRGMAAFSIRAHVAGDAFVIVKALDRVPGDAGIELLLGQLMRHRVIMPFDLYMIINVDPDLFPFGIGISSRGQWLERRLVQ